MFLKKNQIPWFVISSKCMPVTDYPTIDTLGIKFLDFPKNWICRF